MVEPHIKTIVQQIARIAMLFFQRRDVVEHPLAVTPPQPPPCIVMIIGLIGKAVMVAMQSHPINRSALAGQGAHHHENPLKPAGHFKAAVRHKPMQAQGDAKHGHPIQNAEGNQTLPAPKAWE